MRKSERLYQAAEIADLLKANGFTKPIDLARKLDVPASTVYDWVANGVSRSANKENVAALAAAFAEAEKTPKLTASGASQAHIDRLADEIRDSLRFLDPADIQQVWADVMDRTAAAFARRRPEAARAALPPTEPAEDDLSQLTDAEREYFLRLQARMRKGKSRGGPDGQAEGGATG